jgi:16S rRNA (cytosine967-C5)-methyltransferase
MQRPHPGAPRLDDASPGHLLPSPDNAAQGSPARGAALQDGFFYALIHKT